jgi:hypothetical protein
VKPDTFLFKADYIFVTSIYTHKCLGPTRMALQNNYHRNLEKLRELVIFTPVCDITVFKVACIVLAFSSYISIF